MTIRLVNLVGPLFLATTSVVNAQLGPPPFGSSAILPNGATAARPLSQKLSDSLSLLDFGAVCDGVTDDSAAVRAAAGSGRRVMVREGLTCNAPSVTQATMGGVFIGGGKIKGSDGNPRGPQFAAVRVAPNPTSVGDNCSLAFPCWSKYDYSNTFSAEEYHISGAATLGQPVGPGTYQTMPGTIAHNLFIDSSSGWNYSHNSNDGRTGGGAWNTVLQNNGAGDFGVFNAHIQCSGYIPPGDGNTTPGPDGSIINGYTDWLAVPECGFIGATIDAYAPGQYLQIGEFPVEDNGNDVTAIGYVRGYRRTATTAKINNRWIDELVTCNLGLAATLACDAARQVLGSWVIGDDYIGSSVTAPLAMSQGQKITLNGSMPSSPYPEGAPPAKSILGGDWITDDGYGVVVAQNGSPVVRLANNPAAVNYWQVTGSTTGAAVAISPAGTDQTIGAIVSDKGGAGIALLSNGSIAVRAVSANASTGYLNVTAGTATSPLLLQDYSSANQDFAIGAAGTGLVRVAGTTPAAGDASTAVPTTAFTQAAVKSAVSAMIGNRYRMPGYGSGATVTLPVPTGVIDQMIVEIIPNAPTIANMTLIMPAAASIPDGFIVHLITTGTITNFTLNGNTGQTVLAAPGTISPATPLAFMWDSSLTDWIAFR